jgi:hypothetical protein
MIWRQSSRTSCSSLDTVLGIAEMMGLPVHWSFSMDVRPALNRVCQFKHPCTAHALFPKCSNNQCRGFHHTFSEIYTKFDSVPLSDPLRNRIWPDTQFQIKWHKKISMSTQLHEILYTDSQDMLVYDLTFHCATTTILMTTPVPENKDTPFLINNFYNMNLSCIKVAWHGHIVFSVSSCKQLTSFISSYHHSLFVYTMHVLWLHKEFIPIFWQVYLFSAPLNKKILFLECHLSVRMHTHRQACVSHWCLPVRQINIGPSQGSYTQNHDFSQKQFLILFTIQ